MHGYQAHEAVTSDVKMYFKMVLVGFLFGLLAQALILCYCLRDCYHREFDLRFRSGTRLKVPVGALVKYYLPAFRLFGRENRVTISRELQPFFENQRSVPSSVYRGGLERYFGPNIAAFEVAVARAFKLSFFAYSLTVAYLLFFIGISGRMTRSQYLRGAVMMPLPMLTHTLVTAVKQEGGLAGTHLSIGGLPFPRDLETKHILIMGATGTGKSVLFNQVIGRIIDRRRRHGTPEQLIVYDVKGEFLAKHFTPADLLFYPFDPRSLRWSFFNEIRCVPDFNIMSEIIFRPPKDTRADPFWNNAARAVFAAGLRFLHQRGDRSNRCLWEFFCQGRRDIVDALQTLPLDQQAALKHIESPDSAAAASVISTLLEKIDFFQYLTEMDGDFSFRDYILQPAGGNLFLLNISKYAKIWRPLITFAFDVMIREVLSLPDTDQRENRRTWFCIDEIGSLDQIAVLFDLLTIGRSKGGCLIVANQDLGKVEDVYGRPNKMTFYNNFNTGFFLRLNDPDTADFLSRSIGEREVIKRMEGRQLSPKDIGDRKSITDQDKIERLLLPSQFMSLPDFRAIVKFSAYGISEIDIPRQFHEPQTSPFIDRHHPATTLC